MKLIRTKIMPVVWLWMAALGVASCLKDDDDSASYSYYDDAAVTAFTLGTVNQYLHTTNSAGEDSVYMTTYAGSAYKFYIDQENATIYNPDSLPYGTDAAHLLATVTTKNGGVALLKDLVADTYTYHIASDSTDFTSPRILRIVSQSGNSYRDYTVTVNVHQEEADVFHWSLAATEPQLAGLEKLKVAATGGILYVFGYDGYQTQEFASTDGGASWAASNGLLGADAWKNVVVKGSDLFVLDGSRLTKLTGTAWTQVADHAELKQLVGASSSELYALGQNGGLLVSKDDGATWTADALDDDSALLPVTDISCVCQTVKANDQMERVVLIGNCPDASTAVVWTKLTETSATAGSYAWSRVDSSSEIGYAAPKLSGLTAFGYDDALTLFGVSGSAFSPMLTSLDSGIVWKTSSLLSYPDGFDSSTTAFAATVDADNYVWIVCGGTGQVWRGRLNRLGWTAK